MASKFPQALKAARHLSKVDARLKKVIEKVGPIRIELDSEESVFESLARSIVYQQLHGKAAATILGRFKALFPETADFPRPRDVLAMDEQLLLKCGLSRAKTAAIRDLAAYVDLGKIPDRGKADSMDNNELIETLTQVKGIGRWTVEMFLIFTLGRADVLPIHDYGVRNGFASVYRKKEFPTPNELDEIGVKWKPFRSAAAWYFWRALELPEYKKKRKAK